MIYWEQRKLGEIAEYKKGPFGSALRKDIFVQKGKDTVKIYEQQNAICKDWKLERYFVTKEYANKLTGFEVQGGDIIVSCAGTIGEIYEIPYDAEIGIINQALMRIKVYQMVIDKGIFIILFSNLIDKFSIVHSNGSAIKNIPAFSDLKPTIVFVPSIVEQKKIGKCFKTLDHLITLHQSKAFGHILEAIVSCILSWEQRKFGELFLEKRDKTEREDEDVLLSCAITGIYLNSELFSHFRGTSNIGYLKIKKNDLILSAQNLHLGNANVNLLFEHGIISPAYKVYELNKCDQYFVQSWVKKDSTKDFFLNATTEGASQCRKNIDWCILNNQLIAIPSLYEQIRIGKLFHCLNHLITLHQSKLEKLQKIKKSMLESMFV